ncbi:hypothetical protein HYC85_006423 [Camellia sinensis]|uniref:SPX domain-containing protein n=1 Tax=Camellia sinensis TaxID=4442 RepID=A0A7J7HM88_CAMSI|nr:hypothetical protein HYC85_006423 [Camellia sinensis]
MEGMVKKYQQKFRKVKEEMSRWDELQSRLLSQFRNSSFIIQREEFHGIVFFLNKILRDGRQLVKAGSIQAAPKQLQQRIGIKPSLADCLDGLSLIYEMHQSEYGNYSLLNVLHFPPPHCK